LRYGMDGIVMSEKEIFIENLRRRTKKFGVDIIKLCNSMKTSKASAVITYQLIKSATSTGANYRAACVARSKRDFSVKFVL